MKKELQQRYNFYPSLLDKFERYLHADRDYEDFFNLDENGEYKKTYEEIETVLKQSLIDSINRLPFSSEAADKGTCFNEIVDCLIHKRKSDRDDVTIRTIKDVDRSYIEATMNGVSFLFDIGFCKSAASYFKGSSSQFMTEADIQTAYGIVHLYGYVDEMKENKVYDIKTTSRYEFGKYSNGWQKHVYPYCLIESGMCTEIESFEYSAYALKGGTSSTPLITGIFFPEVYKYDHQRTTELLREQCERFIEFIEENRMAITDKKIFNENGSADVST